MPVNGWGGYLPGQLWEAGPTMITKRVWFRGKCLSHEELASGFLLKPENLQFDYLVRGGMLYQTYAPNNVCMILKTQAQLFPRITQDFDFQLILIDEKVMLVDESILLRLVSNVP